MSNDFFKDVERLSHLEGEIIKDGHLQWGNPLVREYNFVKKRLADHRSIDRWHVRFAHCQPILSTPEFHKLVSGLRSKPPLIRVVEFRVFKTEN